MEYKITNNAQKERLYKYSGFPEQEVLDKFNITEYELRAGDLNEDIFDNSGSTEDPVRTYMKNELMDRTGEKPLFTIDEPRKYYGSDRRLNMLRFGMPYDKYPDMPELFLADTFYDRRGVTGMPRYDDFRDIVSHNRFYQIADKMSAVDVIPQKNDAKASNNELNKKSVIARNDAKKRFKWFGRNLENNVTKGSVLANINESILNKSFTDTLLDDNDVAKTQSIALERDIRPFRNDEKEFHELKYYNKRLDHAALINGGIKLRKSRNYDNSEFDTSVFSNSSTGKNKKTNVENFESSYSNLLEVDDTVQNFGHSDKMKNREVNLNKFGSENSSLSHLLDNDIIFKGSKSVKSGKRNNLVSEYDSQIVIDLVLNDKLKEDESKSLKQRKITKRIEQLTSELEYQNKVISDMSILPEKRVNAIKKINNIKNEVRLITEENFNNYKGDEMNGRALKNESKYAFLNSNTNSNINRIQAEHLRGISKSIKGQKKININKSNKIESLINKLESSNKNNYKQNNNINKKITKNINKINPHVLLDYDTVVSNSNISDNYKNNNNKIALSSKVNREATKNFDNYELLQDDVNNFNVDTRSKKGRFKGRSDYDQVFREENERN